MADFCFYGSEEDAYRVLDAILQRPDIRFTPSRNYETKQLNAYSEVDDALKEHLTINKRLYITGDFSTRPIHLREVPGGKYAGTYVVDDYRGGPVMSISLPSWKKRDESLYHFGPGHLFRRNVFWAEDDSEYKAPAEVKAADADLRKRVKSVLKRRQVANETVWIGDGAFELLGRGEALILISGNWLDSSGHFVTSNLPGTSGNV